MAEKVILDMACGSKMFWFDVSLVWRGWNEMICPIMSQVVRDEDVKKIFAQKFKEWLLVITYVCIICDGKLIFGDNDDLIVNSCNCNDNPMKDEIGGMEWETPSFYFANMNGWKRIGILLI